MRQRPRECVLASACALSGQDYETASDLYRAVYGRFWGDDFDPRTSQGWQKRWLEFLDYLGLEPALVGKVVWASSAGRVGGSERAPSGRGLVVATDGEFRHALAVDAAGRVYDPANDRWYESVEAWLRDPQLRGWRVEQFIPEGER